MPSSGAPRVQVSYGELAFGAGTLSTAAANLTALAAVPPVHPPLAADEVSTSAAARLSEHGAVLASRALDAASVLSAAAAAIAAVSTSMAEIDQANASSLGVGGQGAATAGGPATQAAVKANAVAADMPIAPMGPRPGELTAGLIEAGTSSAGSVFQSACGAYQQGFEACAAAARSAQSAVAAGITGKTGPSLSAALTRFASWADEMATHSATVAKAAQDHSGRFEQTQQNTPRTQEFADTRQSLTRAQMLMMQTGGLIGSEQVTRYGSHLQQLDAKATAQGVSYHLAELPQAPPPPPPVADITNDGTSNPQANSGQPGVRPPGPGTEQHGTGAAGADSGAGLDAAASASGEADALADPLAPAGTDPLSAAGPGGSPMGGDPMQQILPMVTMLPAMAAGALGGAVGAVTSVPQQVGQQVMSAAQGLMKGVSAGSSEPDLGEGLAPDDPGVSDFGGGLGSGGGGGGGMEPAGLDTSLPSGGAGALGAASAPSGPAALPNTSSAAPPMSTAAPASAGMGAGMGMMPPMMGAGAGPGQQRKMSEPDKEVKLPSIPNGEPVRGEVERRQTANIEDAAARAAQSAPPGPDRPRRRVVVPPPSESEGDKK